MVLETKEVCPGERLCSCELYTSGPGTFIKNNFIYSSLVGKISEEIIENEKPQISVIRPNNLQTIDIVPTKDDIILGRVSSITNKSIKVDIICTNDIPMKSVHSGIITKTNIRDFDIDQIEVYDCYRPGDIIRAIVLSLGDSRSFFLSTSRIDLGVVYAISDAGYQLEPVAHNCMRCPKTNTMTSRKVALMDMK